MSTQVPDEKEKKFNFYYIILVTNKTLISTSFTTPCPLNIILLKSFQTHTIFISSLLRDKLNKIVVNLMFRIHFHIL